MPDPGSSPGADDAVMLMAVQPIRVPFAATTAMRCVPIGADAGIVTLAVPAAPTTLRPR